MTVRLSQRSLTGIERTEVAVGTVRETSMFVTVRAGAPRSTVYVGSSLAVAGAGLAGSLGIGGDPVAAASAGFSLTGAAVGFSAALATGLSVALLGGVTTGSTTAPGVRADPFGVLPFVAVVPSPTPAPCGRASDSKYETHVGSRLLGSAW